MSALNQSYLSRFSLTVAGDGSKEVEPNSGQTDIRTNFLQDSGENIPLQ